MTSKTILSCGKLHLDTETRLVSGPRGEIRLENLLFKLLKRLMRRPEAIIQTNDLIAALWPNPDEEPDTAYATLKTSITILRNTFISLGCNGRHKVMIINERGVGYYISAWKDDYNIKPYQLDQN
ncbi:hypothetical protein GT348_07710 [Aristophania vespae]|uniref:OmpR/PhoB-type domain-containing protein n=1 Tax=Aristophania vespae TaxID=2697033 RepID=A0A6P1NFS3_9PROT|nr:winged helix-turn-helix domain-containing protein [Aristophania vespae]QHI96133.1 hypothetical protein GT348_07710 [Aristophania vespae]UMM63912.1 hypothetical protein DM15PD_08920 [Aristophania vespae]